MKSSMKLVGKIIALVFCYVGMMAASVGGFLAVFGEIRDTIEEMKG